MRRLLFITVLLLLLPVAAFAAPHEQYTGFASLDLRDAFTDGFFKIVDDLVYTTAYVSVSGGDWQPVVFSSDPWSEGSTLFDLREFSFPEDDESYIIVASCSRIGDSWNCHGGWQLLVVTPGTGTVGAVDGVCPEGADRFDDIDCTFGDPDCKTALDYQCGTRDICGTVHEYGACPLGGYDCVDNLCIAHSDLSCDGVVCAEGEYCARGVCLLNVTGKTYFVALWGNDSTNGTFEEPFYSWQQAASVMYPGDITYFRGGVWMPANRSEDVGLSLTGPQYGNSARLGTPDAWIRYFNYPGEKPILDKRNVEVSSTRWGGGIGMNYIEYIHLRGLTVRNVFQDYPDYTHVKAHSEVSGISCGVCGSIIYENLVVHDIHGRGFQHWSGAWSDLDGEDPPYEVDNTEWINCDAYNLYSIYESEPGNAADGWKVGTYDNYGKNSYTWKNCRAWNYSDDGFDPHGSGLRVFDNCWAMSGEYYRGITSWGTEGNGFKMTGVIPSSVDGYELGGDPGVIVTNSLSANVKYMGFYNNILVDGVGQWSNNGRLINTLAYDGHHGYYVSDGTTYKNNIVYANDAIGPTDGPYEITGGRADYDASHNTWTNESLHSTAYNPAYNVTDEDFISLDYDQLKRPRKHDWSLPDITFAHLARASELIDGGIVVEGYHCPVAGAHPDDDCIEWYGEAPDLGPFESNYASDTSVPSCTDGIRNGDEAGLDCGGSCGACDCSADQEDYCYVAHGVATHTRQCTDGRLGTWSDCEVVSCDTGYYQKDELCKEYIGGEEYIAACQSIYSTGTTYYLMDDVVAQGTCMLILADHVTLDCQGHSITYSSAGGEDDNAVYVRTFWNNIGDSFTLRDCVLIDGSYEVGEATGPAIQLDATRNTTIENVHINTSGTAIRQVNSVGLRIMGSTIFSKSGNALYSQSASTIISNFYFENNYFESKNYAPTVYLSRSDGDILINNTFVGSEPLRTTNSENLDSIDNTIIN